ncbi:MAG: hypothetical protein ABSG91_07020 [Syntrophobacteraceae bacterium]|jgi:hypothetical protein
MASRSSKSSPSSRERTIEPKKKGQHEISFREGGLHSSTETASGKKIPASKHAAAKSGKLGKKAEKQELFYENVLKGHGGKKGK